MTTSSCTTGPTALRTIATQQTLFRAWPICRWWSSRVSHPVSESLDAVLRLGAHLSTMTSTTGSLAATLGLRYSLL